MTKLGAPIRNLSRAEAKAQGLKRYFDGVECPNGHLSDKLVCNYTCIQCLHEKYQAKRKPRRATIQAEKAEKAEIERLHFLSKASDEPASTRREALIRGLTRYFTGIPCKHGHLSERDINNACVDCVRDKPWIKDRAALRKSNSVRVRKLRRKDPNGSRAKVRKMYHTNVQMKLRSVLRCRIKHALKGRTKKPTSALVYLGCSVAEARAHLESLFLPGMTWGNHSHVGWHIDHIIPIAMFDLTDEEQRKKAFHYTNLQPLWARHNHVKQARMLTADQLAQLV